MHKCVRGDRYVSIFGGGGSSAGPRAQEPTSVKRAISSLFTVAWKIRQLRGMHAT